MRKILIIGVAMLVASLSSAPVLAAQDLQTSADDCCGEEDVDYGGCYYLVKSGFWLESNQLKGLQTKESPNGVEADDHIGHEPVGSAECLIIGTKKLINPR